MGETFLGEAEVRFRALHANHGTWLNTSLPAIGAVIFNDTDLIEWQKEQQTSEEIYSRHKLQIPKELIKTGEDENVLKFRYVGHYCKEASRGLQCFTDQGLD